MTGSDPREELAFLTDQLKTHVADNREPAVYSRTPLTQPDPAAPRPAPSKPAAEKPVESLQEFFQDAEHESARVPAGKTPTLDALRAHIGDCHLCPLGDTRTKLVFGVGNPAARVMCVGEGPGFSEDRQGEPFVGPAGQLLDKILAALGLSRQPQTPDWKWVYIANIVKCHPMIDPKNSDKRGNDRPPAPPEIEKCMPFLQRQLALIKPDYILGLGATAVKALLKTGRGISSIHGQWTDFPIEGTNATARFLPLYHPAALLRNPDLKKDVWNAVKPLAQELQGRYS